MLEHWLPNDQTESPHKILYTNHVRYSTKLEAFWTSFWFPLTPMNFIICDLWYQSCSRGSAITRPKMETSNNIIQVGIDCFLSFLLSIGTTSLFTSPFESSSFNRGFEFSSSGVSAGTCSGIIGCCCWLNFSTYSGNIFRNVALFSRKTVSPNIIQNRSPNSRTTWKKLRKEETHTSPQRPTANKCWLFFLI